MKVKDKAVVSIHYKMKNSKGEILEDTLDSLPISYLHGTGAILPSLEVELKGLSVGEKKLIFMSKDQGYKDLDDEFYIEVTVDQIRRATTEELENGLLPQFYDDFCGPEGCC